MCVCVCERVRERERGGVGGGGRDMQAGTFVVGVGHSVVSLFMSHAFIGAYVFLALDPLRVFGQLT